MRINRKPQSLARRQLEKVSLVVRSVIIFYFKHESADFEN